MINNIQSRKYNIYDQENDDIKQYRKLIARQMMEENLKIIQNKEIDKSETKNRLRVQSMHSVESLPKIALPQQNNIQVAESIKKQRDLEFNSEQKFNNQYQQKINLVSESIQTNIDFKFNNQNQQNTIPLQQKKLLASESIQTDRDLEFNNQYQQKDVQVEQNRYNYEQPQQFDQNRTISRSRIIEPQTIYYQPINTQLTVDQKNLYKNLADMQSYMLQKQQQSFQQNLQLKEQIQNFERIIQQQNNQYINTHNQQKEELQKQIDQIKSQYHQKSEQKIYNIAQVYKQALLELNQNHQQIKQELLEMNKRREYSYHIPQAQNIDSYSGELQHVSVFLNRNQSVKDIYNKNVKRLQFLNQL